MSDPTAPLHMIQLQPNAFRASAWMAQHKVARPGHDDGYGWHALLTAAFGALAPKPFRVVEHMNRPTQLLGYTSADPATLLEHAGLYAEPAVAAALALDRLEEKQMPGAFRLDQRLGFEVRVRPTVRQDRNGDRRASREKDAFLAAVDNAAPREERDDLKRETVYRAWLAARVGTGARLETLRLQSLRRAMLLRRGRRTAEDVPRALVPIGASRRGVPGEQGGSPDAIFTGTLVVEDPLAFRALLARGVGRHRAFGFGMLLLRPPRPE